MYTCTCTLHYSSRDERERGNIQGYTDIRVDFRDFRFVRFQDFSKDFGISRFLKCYTRFQGSFEPLGLGNPTTASD